MGDAADRRATDFVTVNGIRLAYERSGSGEPVLMIMGSGCSGRVWTMHQTPALHAAGYATVVFDNRGIPPSDAPPGKYPLAELVADTRGLIEALDLAPCRIVGMSLGAMIAQELAIEHPELVRCAVLIATRARADAARLAQTEAEIALVESGVRLPAAYEAATTVFKMFSPATLDDDRAVAGWLEVFELAGTGIAAAGQTWAELTGDRRAALRQVTAPCRVVTFADDLMTPPHLGAEVAEAIPRCDLAEIPGCGHLGCLERPDAVNAAITEFLDNNRGGLS
ncbi:alpha/beta hydrolase [Amycolatopsis balhimycina DSM 5908]|uniref:Alpha/beta hydrolase n=1 Tax=Amycolatopsis balhimycina DSM 5908 TaxID=1081091 RepID=A0A428WMW9_AMYBA|nr:alpha/beta fold hydrolase [Amycolatopsis balhimycina]RSM44437.1 alpha/beta hydrolase [Amycolatopsis balhimycina DSM 5908]